MVVEKSTSVGLIYAPSYIWEGLWRGRGEGGRGQAVMQGKKRITYTGYPIRERESAEMYRPRKILFCF